MFDKKCNLNLVVCFIIVSTLFPRVFFATSLGSLWHPLGSIFCVYNTCLAPFWEPFTSAYPFMLILRSVKCFWTKWQEFAYFILKITWNIIVKTSLKHHWNITGSSLQRSLTKQNHPNMNRTLLTHPQNNPKQITQTFLKHQQNIWNMKKEQ